MAKIWIGVRFRISDVEVHAATTLKGLCDLTEVSYSTAKAKKGLGCFLIFGGKDTMRGWTFMEVELVKVSGRGSKEGFRVGKGK